MAERFGRPPADPNLAPASVPPARLEPDDDDVISAPAPAPLTTRGPGSERIDSQVQKAQEQLLNLKRQQEQIERQKRELEELSRRQEELESGRGEMVEKLTRALVVVERQSTEAAKRVEQLHATGESFASHLQALEGINPKVWPATDLQRELSRALGMVDHARTDFNQQKARIATETAEGDEAGGASGADTYDQMFGTERDHSFLYWLKAGVAFTLPLIIALFALFIFCWLLFGHSL